ARRGPRPAAPARAPPRLHRRGLRRRHRRRRAHRRGGHEAAAAQRAGRVQELDAEGRRRRPRARARRDRRPDPRRRRRPGDARARRPRPRAQPGMKAGRREWIGLAAIALPCVLYAMDLTVLNLALPRISADLHPTSSELLWIVDIYGFLVAGMLVTMGNLGDRIGRRRLLLLGAVVFGAGSAAAAFATSATLLIAARAVLGV